MTSGPWPVCIVVPCYNEAKRLDAAAFAAFAQANDWVRFLFVDDGSADRTAEFLADLAAKCPERIQWFSLEKNSGKSEAVRQGFLRAFASEPAVGSVGFWDADLATPLADIRTCADILAQRDSLLAVFGSRVNLLGRDVKRNLLRHYIGRVFATTASAVLKLPIYDTQCGAKLLRATPIVQGVFAKPFQSVWIFDVEMIARLCDELAANDGPTGQQVIYEHPLSVWRDVAGSKLRAKHFLKAGVDMWRIAWRQSGRGGFLSTAVLAICRRLLRGLQTTASRVGGISKLLRGIAMVPVFGFLLVLLRLRLWLRGPLVVQGLTHEGVNLRCRLPDLIQMYVYLFGVWEPDLTAFLWRRLSPGDLFVDVGANVGCMTGLASKRVADSGQVIAIEPSPAVIAELERTIASNQLRNVRLVRSAVSDRREELTLFAGPEHNVGLTATTEHRGLKTAGTVQAAPLGDLLSADELARARIVKIDVEGAEDRVLAGVLPIIDRLSRDCELIVELSPTWWSDKSQRPINVLQPFLDRGFHVFLLPNNYWPWRYLWPKDVGPPRRLRDLSVLQQRVPRLDVVLSRRTDDTL